MMNKIPKFQIKTELVLLIFPLPQAPIWLEMALEGHSDLGCMGVPLAHPLHWKSLRHPIAILFVCRLTEKVHPWGPSWRRRQPEVSGSH